MAQAGHPKPGKPSQCQAGSAPTGLLAGNSVLPSGGVAALETSLLLSRIQDQLDKGLNTLEKSCRTKTHFYSSRSELCVSPRG